MIRRVLHGVAKCNVCERKKKTTAHEFGLLKEVSKKVTFDWKSMLKCFGISAITGWFGIIAYTDPFGKEVQYDIKVLRLNICNKCEKEARDAGRNVIDREICYKHNLWEEIYEAGYREFVSASELNNYKISDKAWPHIGKQLIQWSEELIENQFGLLGIRLSKKSFFRECINAAIFSTVLIYLCEIKGYCRIYQAAPLVNEETERCQEISFSLFNLYQEGSLKSNFDFESVQIFPGLDEVGRYAANFCTNEVYDEATTKVEDIESTAYTIWMLMLLGSLYSLHFVSLIIGRVEESVIFEQDYINIIEA